jgi:hypothetical protein
VAGPDGPAQDDTGTCVTKHVSAWCGRDGYLMFRCSEMAKTGAFLGVPKAPFLGSSNTAPDRNPSICRALRPWGSGWLVAPYRAPFFIGATPASCDIGPVTSGSHARGGERTLALLCTDRTFFIFGGQPRAGEAAIRLRSHNDVGPGESQASAPIDVDGQSRRAGIAWLSRC